MGQGWKKYDYDYLVFGKRVQEYRLALKRSLGDLSRETGIDKGSLSRVEKGEISLPEKKRRKLIDVLLEALKKTANNGYLDRHEFLKLAGLTVRSSAVRAPDISKPRSNTTAMFYTFTGSMLELADTRIADLQQKLYAGKGRVVYKEAQQWYSQLKSTSLSETDRTIAAMQIRFGILLGQAQELVIPTYQRARYTIPIYKEVEEIISHFPLNSFEYEYSKLLALRAPLYREARQFERSLQDFENGLDYAEKVGDRYLKATLLRDRAHIWAAQGDEKQWKKAIERANLESIDSKEIASVLKVLEGQGYRRLAYNPLMPLQESTRKRYAEAAIACFKEAQEKNPNPSLPDTHPVGFDGLPLLRMHSTAQCYLWIDPEYTLNILEGIKPQAARSLPMLLSAIECTATWANMRLDWLKSKSKRGAPSSVFNLDDMYVRKPSSNSGSYANRR